MKEGLFLKVFGGIFFSVGALMLLLGFSLFTNTQAFMDSAEKTEGRVVQMDERVSRDSNGHSSTSYYPIVTFKTTQGQEVTFNSSTGSNPPSYSVGDLINIFYNPQSPSQAKVDSVAAKWGAVLIVGLLGLVFGSIGGAILFFTIRSERAKKWVKRYGHEIEAEVVDVGFNQSFAVNGRHPWRVTCQWLNPTTNKVHTFTSENTWVDPSPYIKRGDMLRVKVNTKKPKYHWVYIENTLPQAA